MKWHGSNGMAGRRNHECLFVTQHGRKFTFLQFNTGTTLKRFSNVASCVFHLLNPLLQVFINFLQALGAEKIEFPGTDGPKVYCFDDAPLWPAWLPRTLEKMKSSITAILGSIAAILGDAKHMLTALKDKEQNQSNQEELQALEDQVAMFLKARITTSLIIVTCRSWTWRMPFFFVIVTNQRALPHLDRTVMEE